MSLYKILHWFFGVYTFKIQLVDFSRLANLLTTEKLRFWGWRADGREMYFYTSLFSAEKVYDIAKKSDISIEITEKRGLPFVFSKYRKRYGLIVGLAFGLFLMFYARLFVWKINISGNKEIKSYEIERELAEIGITVGSYIPEIDGRVYANKLLINYDALSSCAISINGTQVFVSVLEKTPTPDFLEKEGFANVVAERDGVILDINASNGTPMVSQGEAVYKGQLLINSFMESSNGTFRPTYAYGTVYAAVRETFFTEIPLKRTMRNYTGNSQTKKVYEVLGREMPSVSGLESPYEYFDAVTSEKWINLFGFIELPIKEYRVTYSEYIPEIQPIDQPYAEAIVKSQLDTFLRDLDLELLECDYKIQYEQEKGVCRLTATALLKQDIAKVIPFDIENQIISERLPKARE